MKKLWKRLGKFVQELLNKIFKKKTKTEEPEWKSYTTFGPGTLYIDDKVFTELKSLSANSWENIRKVFEDGEINLGTLNILPETKMEKNFFNIPLTLLPKRYPCKTLILTLAANQEEEYQAVDMSQYSSGLAHYIIGRKEGWDEVIQEYLEEEEFESEEELQEEKEWLREVREVAEADGFYSAIMGEATLLHYEELGVWDIE